MLLQACGLSSLRVYQHLNVSLSLHNLSKLLLKKLDLMSAVFYTYVFRNPKEWSGVRIQAELTSLC